MNKKVLLASLVIFSSHVPAAQIWMKGSDCDINESATVINIFRQHFDSITTLMGKEPRREQIETVATDLLDGVKRSLFEALIEKSEEQGRDLIIDKVVLKERLKDNGKLVAVSGRIFAYPVIACRTKTAITADNYEMITATAFSKKTHTVSSQITIDLNAKRAEQKVTQVKDTAITPTEVFGVALGDTFAAAEQQIGRFTLVWPVNSHQKLATIGRNHAFLFEHDKLVGYQYAFTLLPVALANLINIHDIDAKVQVEDESLAIIHRPLSQHHVSVLTARYANVAFFQEGRYTKTPNTKLSELTIGRFHIDEPTTPPCYQGKTDIDLFIEQQQSHLIQWQDVERKTILYTGCHQLMELNKLGKVTSVKLQEAWSLRNANLIGLASISQVLLPWQFYGISYLDPQSAASKLGKVERFYDTIEVAAPKWVGHFKAYEGQLVSAEFEKM
ncbi:hypothetical protein J8Z24_00385 [Pseudoalteromonas sp. SCSIO 43201]|uniref:hypothetical protein n=1 Tax=Pseudoalteromonas sp. SCSIO 43201 TaxID=2822842 RepID=UPI0020757E35|nr:hypothetical protein [Pseudoalteromonas sp. SCSIO 43201]USD28612.1 hypothetical protein J8Z24_00385 [Pseudoalteromonas sp. SCSIO 43201]